MEGYGDMDIPFEAHAIEALLTTVNSLHVQDFDHVNKDVHDVLSVFKSGAILPVDKQEKMRTLKNAVTLMKSRTLGHKRVLLDVMEDDETMALMNLTKLKHNSKLYTLVLRLTFDHVMNRHDCLD